MNFPYHEILNYPFKTTKHVHYSRRTQAIQIGQKILQFLST